MVKIDPVSTRTKTGIQILSEGHRSLNWWLSSPYLVAFFVCLLSLLHAFVSTQILFPRVLSRDRSVFMIALVKS